IAMSDYNKRRKDLATKSSFFGQIYLENSQFEAYSKLILLSNFYLLYHYIAWVVWVRRLLRWHLHATCGRPALALQPQPATPATICQNSPKIQSLAAIIKSILLFKFH